MEKSLRGKSFISLMDWSAEELEKIFDLAPKLKQKWTAGEQPGFLKGKQVAMIFANPSTRTRTSFESGISWMGGHAQYHTPDTMQIAHKETWEDTGKVLGRYVHGIIVRMFGLKQYGMARDILRVLEASSKVPVINALDDKEHPCQIMADIMTMREKLGPDYKQKKIVMSWAYSERVKSAGVPQTMTIAAGLLGMNLVLAYPEKYDVDPEYMEFAKKHAALSGGKITVTHDIYEACRDADVIYAKSWGSFAMSKEEDKKYRERFKRDWCIGRKHFDLAKPSAVFMHCLPANRNQEVTDEIIDGPMSIVYDEAENRLHAQNALLALIL